MTDMPNPAAWGLPDFSLEPIPGGHRNRVLRSREQVENGQAKDWVFKSTRRSEAQLFWLRTCMPLARAAGFELIAPVLTLDGAHSHEGWTAEPFVKSRPLDMGARPRFRNLARRLHKAGFGRVQRPGFLHARGLLLADTGGDVDLSAMPPEVVQRCRAAFAAIPSGPLTLIHGDLNPSNVGIKPSGHFVVYDWDEARVDHPLFDLVAIGALQNPVPVRAALAFEIATCWHTEPERAMTLAERL